jgi:hypothetical protein
MKKILFILSLFLLAGCTVDTSIALEESVDTVEVNTMHVVKGCILTYGETEYRMHIESNNVDIHTIGTYTIDYTYEIEETEYTCQRVVFVVDQTSPVLTLNPGIDTIKIGENWEDSGIIIEDNYDTELVYTVEGTIDNMTVGDYVITYVTIDSSGNTGTIDRVVHVIE